MWSWGALSVWVPLLGATLTALLFHPLVLSLAAWFLAKVAQKQWSHLASVGFAFAFLASTQVGKILMYDVHPEVAYPFFLILWYWAMTRDSDDLATGLSWSSGVILILATLLLIETKEDSFLVFFPWLAWMGKKLPASRRKAVWISGGVALAGLGFQMVCVQKWVSGQWGPSMWQGYPVLQQASVGEFGGLHWSGLKSVGQILGQFLDQNQGLWGVLQKCVQFVFSRPWISLLVLAPWVVKSVSFWLLSLPLLGVYSLLEGPRHLWNYYSAPFLGTFWLCAVLGKKGKLSAFAPLGSVLAACLLGSSSVDFFRITPEIQAKREQALTLAPCLQGRGVVASPLLGLVDRGRVFSDRVPSSLRDVDFFLFLPRSDLFAWSLAQAQALYADLEKPQSGFCQITSCQGISLPQGASVVLFEKCPRGEKSAAALTPL
jgi:hypothetical protein